MKSIKNLITLDVVRPSQVRKSTKSYFFSAFGVPTKNQEPTKYLVSAYSARNEAGQSESS
ncbi:hypothetical protein EON65_14365 [archaeon]|nr:MAG: hypothetical protein EON65_14365 [archaeon]